MRDGSKLDFRACMPEDGQEEGEGKGAGGGHLEEVSPSFGQDVVHAKTIKKLLETGEPQQDHEFSEESKNQKRFAQIEPTIFGSVRLRVGRLLGAA
jgi:hypothetical protein